MTRRKIAACFIGLLSALAIGTVSTAAVAQDYPTHRITIIVPFTAGSAFDIVARVVAQKVQDKWGQPVVVENKPGASGSIGTDFVAKAAPDGYTLLVTGSPHSLHKTLIKSLRYDPVTDFTPLGVLATGAVALVVNPNVFPVKSLDELIAAAKAQPGKLNHSSPGIGTLQHLGMELFKQQLGINVLHVPYRGQSRAITDLVAGQVQMTYLPVNSAMPLVRAGKLRMLAVASSKRSPLAPDVPSLSELGHPTLDFMLWFGFFAPAKLPADIQQKWEKELAAIAEMPDVDKALENKGLIPTYMDSKATAAWLQSEIARWKAVVDKAGLKAK